MVVYPFLVIPFREHCVRINLMPYDGGGMPMLSHCNFDLISFDSKDAALVISVAGRSGTA